MNVTTLNKLYVDELKDLYNAENQVLKALPRMAEKASNTNLRTAFEEHLKQTRGQVARLEQIFTELGESPTGKVCKGMKGLIEEGEEVMEEVKDPDVCDAAMIGAAQRVEHYEMAGYGTARTFATLLGFKDQAKLLQETLDEEGETDKKLTKLAESHVNKKALMQAA